MNSYFYKLWLPMQIVTIVAITQILFFNLSVNWWGMAIVWFLIGPVGVGVGYHKLFTHRQFNTWKPIEYLLAMLGTLVGYASVGFFIANHVYHHKHSDTELDPSTPNNGFWNSFFWWRLTNKVLKQTDLRNEGFKRFLADNVLRFIAKQYEYIIYVYVIILLVLFGWPGIVSFFVLPTFIEHTRINFINSISHINVPFSYQNFDTNDNSQNNYLFGLMSLGFGWHNNHHKYPREILNTHNWWELDIEGIISKILDKNTYK